MLSFRMACAAAILLTGASSAFAAPTLIVDARSGEVISSNEATRPWNPASTTKMMTAYVALRAVREGRIGMETAIPVSRLAAAQRPSKLGVRPGSEITLENALKVMMVKSANDLAVVIGEGVGGSLPNFIAMMNAEARRLGMRESHFLTPHGFHQPGQRTSARDLAILARALLLEFPEQRDLWGIGAVQVGSRVLQNTNGLIGRYPGAEGMKTGFVCASGFNLVGMASRGGRTLIAVVLGAGSGAERSVKTAQLLDEGFSSWSSTGQQLASLPGSGYDSAPDMRAEICRRGRGVLLSDDDSAGAFTIAYENQRNGDFFNSVMEGVRGRPVGGGGSITTRNAAGRVTLGQRAYLHPVQIALGRTAGSASAPLAANVTGARPQPTMIARGKPEPAKPEPAQPAARPTAVAATPPKPAPAETTAFAPTEDAAPAQAPVAASAGSGFGAIGALFAPFRSAPAAAAPLALHEPPETRPGAAAAIRPKPAAAPAKPERKKIVAGRPAKPKPAAAKPAPAAPATE